jgi:hypothetical protein
MELRSENGKWIARGDGRTDWSLQRVTSEEVLIEHLTPGEAMLFICMRNVADVGELLRHFGERLDEEEHTPPVDLPADVPQWHWQVCVMHALVYRMMEFPQLTQIESAHLAALDNLLDYLEQRRDRSDAPARLFCSEGLKIFLVDRARHEELLDAWLKEYFKFPSPERTLPQA